MEGSIYAPGAGHRPPLLAGREDELSRWADMVARVAEQGRRPARDMLLTGPRGVGKTVMMSEFADLAGRQGFVSLPLQAVQRHSDLVASLVRRVERQAQAGDGGPWARVREQFQRLSSVTVGPVSLSRGPTPAEAASARTVATDPSDVADALAGLAREVRRDNPRGGVMLSVDELQVVSSEDVALLSATLHRLNVEHPEAAVAFCGTGLPHTMSHLRKAGVTHPERLYTETRVDTRLSEEAARAAIRVPAQAQGVTWQASAIDGVVELANRYPAHLQMFADEAWAQAVGPDQITEQDLRLAAPVVLDRLEQQAYGPRWDEMPDREREYLVAVSVAASEHGYATSEQVEAALERPAKASSEPRDALIQAGDLYSPRRGHIALTTPLLGKFAQNSYDHTDTSGRLKTGLRSIDQMRDGVQTLHARAGVNRRPAARRLAELASQLQERANTPDPRHENRRDDPGTPPPSIR